MNANKQKHVEEMRRRIEARLLERGANTPTPTPKTRKMTIKERKEREKKRKSATAKQKKLMSKPIAGINLNQTANGKITPLKLKKLKERMRSVQNQRAAIAASRYE